MTPDIAELLVCALGAVVLYASAYRLRRRRQTQARIRRRLQPARAPHVS